MARMIRSTGDGRRRGSTRAAQAPGDAAVAALAPTPPPGRRSAAWAPLLAVALLAAAGVGVVLLDSRPAHAQLTDVTIWSATLTVKQIDANSQGCANFLPAGKRCSESAVLSNDEVTFDGTTYTITNVFAETDQLEAGLFFSSTTPFVSEQLTFHVGGTRYAFADRQGVQTQQFQWILAHSWTVGQIVTLKITGPPPLPPPRKPPPPDPNEPEQQPKRCACTQVAAAHFPDRCSKCAIIRSCGTT